jgi:K+-transporting ATPase c subunit
MGKSVEDKVRKVLETLLEERKESPLGGLVGMEMVNVLELNLAMAERMAKLASEYP